MIEVSLKKYYAIFEALLLGVILLLPVSLNANNSSIDSLKTLLKTDISDSLKAELYNELGNELLLKSHAEALDNYYMAKELSEQINDTTGVVYNLLGISDVHSLLGEYKTSLKNILEAHRIAYGNKILLASTHSRLAIGYFDIGDNELSIKHDRLSLKYNKLNADTIQMAYDYHNIGTYYLAINKNDSAIINYQFSKELIKGHQDDLIAYNNSRMGFAYSNKEEYKRAISFHLMALEYFTNDSILYDMALEENYIASAFYNHQKIDSAYKHASKALELSKSLNNHDLNIQNYSLLYDIYKYKKDDENALKYLTLQSAYADSIEQKNRESITATLETKYKYQEQKKILEASEQRNKLLKKQKVQLIIFSILCGLLSIFCIVIVILKYIEHRKNKQLVKKLDRVGQSRHKLLSIIGHDLRSSIGNLKNFTELMHYNLLDNKSIEEMLGKYVPMVDSADSLLETLLIWSKNTDGNLTTKKESLSAKEIVNTCILHLEQVAKIKGIKIVHHPNDDHFVADKNMVLTVLRNLISNAIKFSNENSEVEVKYCTSQTHFEFSVKDSGVGMNEDEVKRLMNNKLESKAGTQGEKGSGIGLELCKSLMALHGAEILVSSKKNEGSLFKIVIPQSTTN